MKRRQFVNTLAGMALASVVPFPSREQDRSSPTLRADTPLETFEYKGVRLLPGMFSRQVEQTREVYSGLPNDDILKGFRRAAGQPAPGNDMTGWARQTCSSTFGQWLSGMARMSAALNDSALREKAIALADGWGKTIGPDGDPRMGFYPWDKMVGGLVDLHVYAAWEPALPLLERTMRSVAQTLDRSRSPATDKDRSGRLPKNNGEWYTLSESLYRAYLATGNSAYRDFGDVWRYEPYWGAFETSPAHPRSFLHAYSHVNTFGGAAMAYAITGDKRYRRIIQNAYDYIRGTQCYASGGYGPGEWSVPPDGTLGTSLEVRTDHAEIPCGAWAGFKLSRYLMGFTGEARYGDWIETLLYNGIGATLPMQPDGRTFYYADYRLGAATKLYHWDTWPCCSGTYLQTVADYHNVIYFKNPAGLFVNLYVPSEVSWNHSGQKVTVRQETSFPEGNTSTLRFDVQQPVRLELRLRVPSWANGFAVAVNGQSAVASAKTGEWAALERTWNPGDQVTVKIPTELRLAPIDAQHPRRAAVMFGPVLLAQEARFTMPLSLRPDEELSQRLVRDGNALQFRAVDRTPPEQRGVSHSLPGEVGAFQPFYDVPERQPYRVYFDLDNPKFL